VKRERRSRDVAWLVGLILLAAGYVALMGGRLTLTGERSIDGGIAVVLGLFLCAHPAAYAIDLLFYSRFALDRPSWAEAGWFLLNLLVLLAGWLTILSGTTRLAAA
jgi:hypothetical protein